MWRLSGSCSNCWLGQSLDFLPRGDLHTFWFWPHTEGFGHDFFRVNWTVKPRIWVTFWVRSQLLCLVPARNPNNYACFQKLHPNLPFFWPLWFWQFAYLCLSCFGMLQVGQTWGSIPGEKASSKAPRLATTAKLIGKIPSHHGMVEKGPLEVI